MIKDLDHDVQIRMQTYSNPKVRNLAIHDIPAPDEKEDLRSCPVAPCFLGNPFFASKLLCTTVINVTNLPSAMLKQAHIQKKNHQYHIHPYFWWSTKIINTISIHIHPYFWWSPFYAIMFISPRADFRLPSRQGQSLKSSATTWSWPLGFLEASSVVVPPMKSLVLKIRWTVGWCNFSS